MTRKYNDPASGSPSNVGTQMNDFYYDKKALVEAKRAQYFMPLSGTVNMPKNMGKKIKKFHYLPLLDDANINDQGIDAAGATLVASQWTAWDAAGVVQGTTYATQTDAQTGAGAGGSVSANGGNLYGSSKDVGAITGKLPVLSESGGRVNRVGFKRKDVEGSIAKFGYFDEYSQESVDFDSDADLQMHIRREMVNGSHEITEDALQVDLLNSAGVVKYVGTATQASEVNDTALTYKTFLRLSIELDQNRTPKQTKVITGTRNIDTRVVRGGRIMYIGSELQASLEGMTDLHGAPAFISVEKYAANGATLNGEIGSIGHFRIVVVPEMQRWSGAGADASATDTHYETAGKYDVFPMLVVGDGSFTTIGFQTDGKAVKFSIKHAKPGSDISYANDPYGETGFMSIKWYYGFLLERSERIALIKVGAEM
jgi:N4-gp56 family major capsid protein